MLPPQVWLPMGALAVRGEVKDNGARLKPSSSETSMHPAEPSPGAGSRRQSHGTLPATLGEATPLPTARAGEATDTGPPGSPEGDALGDWGLREPEDKFRVALRVWGSEERVKGQP